MSQVLKNAVERIIESYDLDDHDAYIIREIYDLFEDFKMSTNIYSSHFNGRPISDIISEYEADPDRKKSLDKARAELKGMIGDDD